LIFSFILSFSSIQNASAAVLFDTTSSTGTNYGFTSSVIGISPITIPAAATIQSVVMKIAQGNGSGVTIAIFADNAGAPAASPLGTLTYASYTSPNATYTGSVTLPAAGKYWFKFSTTVSFQNYYSTTPVTTGSLSGWSIGRMLESINSGSSYTTRSDNLVYLLTINGTGGVLQSSSSITLSTPIQSNFRQVITLTASLGVVGTDGLVTFYANGKKIAGCINKLSSALSVSCSWKPSQRGTVLVSASLKPTDSGYASSTSATKTILVGTRTNTR